MATQSKVVLTRRRWNIYMSPTALASMLAGAYCCWSTGEARLALLPILPLYVWAMIFWMTPRRKVVSPTIHSSPGALTMLGASAIAVVAFGTGIAIDCYLLGHAVRDPMEPYHFVVFAPTFAVIFVGAYLADRVAERCSNSCQLEER